MPEPFRDACNVYIQQPYPFSFCTLAYVACQRGDLEKCFSGADVVPPAIPGSCRPPFENADSIIQFIRQSGCPIPLHQIRVFSSISFYGVLASDPVQSEMPMPLTQAKVLPKQSKARLDQYGTPKKTKRMCSIHLPKLRMQGQPRRVRDHQFVVQRDHPP